MERRSRKAKGRPARLRPAGPPSPPPTCAAALAAPRSPSPVRRGSSRDLESAKRHALSLVTGIPTPSVADRARVVSPEWSEPDLASPYAGKLRRCQKVYAVYERAAEQAQEGEEALPLAA
jgi:hypothetical protein